MNPIKIDKNISIEELVEEVPQSVHYLMQQGIKCVACGEPIWGTLEDAAREKGFSDGQINQFVKELQEFADNPDKKVDTTELKIDVKKFRN